MKPKDLIGLAFLAIALVVVGSFLISKVGRGGQPRSAEVELVAPINPTFNEAARTIILGQSEHSKATPFSAPVNLSGGFGNTRPFGP